MIVLVPASVHKELEPSAREIAPDVRLIPYREEQETVNGADEAEAVVRWIAGKRYASLAADGPRVRWLHTASAGVDHVLTPGITQKAQAGNLIVTDSGPAFGVCLGEWALAWMLAVSHRLPEIWNMQAQRDFRWLAHTEIFGQTAGIIGLGPIGRGVASRCRAMGMRTLGLRRRPDPVPDVDETLTGRDGLQRLLSESDWVILCAAHTEETRAMLGAEELALMRPHARVVNIARGPIIDEAALMEALRGGQIAGACLDVFWQEPLPPDSPWWNVPNACISPHTSSWTVGLRERQKQLFLDNLRRFTQGEPLDGVVDVTRGY